MAEETTTVKSNSRRPLWQWLVLLVVLAVIALLAFRQRATAPEKASISSSATSQAGAGRTVTVPIEVDTAGQTINAAEVYIKFDPAVMQVESISKDSSIFIFWIPGQPKFDNQKGELSFAAGLPNPGFNGKGKIGSVTLSSKVPISTKLTFGSGTQALLNDGKATVLPLKLSPIEVVIK